MPGVYHIYLTDPLGALPSGLDRAVMLQLNLFFDPVTGDFFELALVKRTTGAVMPAANELLVYFMPSGVSIVKKIPNLQRPVDLSSDGNTVWVGDLTASEVYKRSNDPQLLARLAFHELMHNKLHLGNEMHTQQDGLGAKDIYPSTQLTVKNIKSMAKVIRTPRPQWTDGISLLTSGMHDPMSEYSVGRR